MKKYFVFSCVAFANILFSSFVAASPVCVPTEFVEGVTGSDCNLPLVQGVLPVIDGSSFYATGGDILAIFAGEASSAEDIIAVNGDPIFDNMTTPLGTVDDLGYFSPGELITLSIFVTSTGETYYSGSGISNPDGQVHWAEALYAATSAVPYSGCWYGPEDGLSPATSGNDDYNDAPVILTNTTCGGATQQASTPEPATFLMLGGGLIAVGLIRQRRRRL